MPPASTQIQANLGEGHVNVINAKEALLTESHLALVMEYAACGSLTGYVAGRWQAAQHSGLFLQEDEARYFFRVSSCSHQSIFASSELRLATMAKRWKVLIRRLGPYAMSVDVLWLWVCL